MDTVRALPATRIGTRAPKGVSHFRYSVSHRQGAALYESAYRK